MSGEDIQQSELFSYGSLEELVPEQLDTTCCSAGLSGSRPMTRFAIRRYSRRTGTDYWKAVSEQFFSPIVMQARRKRLLSDEHFTVDGSLIEGWARQKSCQWKDRDDDPLNPPPVDKNSNPMINWHSEKRSNATHESITDAHGVAL